MKLCSSTYLNKSSDETKNYSNILYLMEKTLTKFNIAEANIREGKELNITHHIYHNEKDLVNTLYAIEKMYSFSYENFINIFDFSKKMSICLYGGGTGKFAETIKLINPANDVNIIDDKPVEHIVNDYLKKNQMENHIFLISMCVEKDDLLPNADLYIISYFLHWNNLSNNKKLFQRIIESLNSDGKLVLIEFMYDKDPKLLEIIKKESIKNDEYGNSMAFFNSGFSIMNSYNGYSPSIKEILNVAKEVGFNNSQLIRSEGFATIVILSKETI